jgi:hypothetical protein
VVHSARRRLALLPLLLAPALARGQDVLWRVSSPVNRFGSDATLMGDVNGDGARDVLVAAPVFYQSGAGQLFGLDGTSGAQLFALADPTSTLFGESVVALGSDLDGDGVEEFASEATVTGSQSTTVLIFSGATRALLRSIRSRRPAGTRPRTSSRCPTSTTTGCAISRRGGPARSRSARRPPAPRSAPSATA